MARLVGSPDVVAAQERARNAADGRRKAPQRRAQINTRRYRRWRDALRPAADALFSLNRYAKWKRCAPNHRKEIYALKTHFLRLLCAERLAQDVRRHVQQREALKCFACRGVGKTCVEALDGLEADDGVCPRCGGSGWYRRPDLEFIVFRFVVGGQVYCWHQPCELVDWPSSLSEGPEAWEPADEEKPIPLSPGKFAAAKDLIRYVLESAASEQQPGGSVR